MRTIQFNNKEMEVKALRTSIANITSLSNKYRSAVNHLNNIYDGYISSPKKILLEFPVEFDDYRTHRKVSEFFFSEEEVMLVNPLNESTFFLCKIEGEIDKKFDGSAAVYSVTLVASLPVEYSIREYDFSNIGNLIEINNPGTEPMLLELEATFKSDNGFLALENDDMSTSCLFGDVEEVDGKVFEKSQLLFDDHFTADRGWILNKGITPPVTGQQAQNGTVSYQVDSHQPDPKEGYVRVQNWGSGYSWHGASITKDVPADSNGVYAKNWCADYRFDFNSDGAAANAKGRQVGHNSMTFVDEFDEIICSVIFEDNHSKEMRSDMVVFIDGKKAWSTKQNKEFFVTGRPGKGAYVRVEKIEDKVTVSFSYAKIKKTFITKKKNSVLRKATWYGAAYGSNTPMQNNLLRAINIKKHNVTAFKDLPNKLSKDDVLRYGKNGRHIYCTLNDLQGLQIRDPGSSLIYAPPGQSKILAAWSDWADTPEIKLKGRAAYI